MSEVLLPANSSQQEFALEQTTARIADVPVRVREVWNAATCPADLLPWLAWAYSVDEWDAAWTTEQKRNAILAAVEVQRHKGTIGAVREALGALGYNVRVQEWFNQIPEGAPYTFRLLLESSQVGIDQAALAKIFDVLNTYKNLRSHLVDIDPSVVTRAGPVMAGVSSTGNEITVAFGGGNLISDGFALSNGTYKSNGLKVATI